MLTAVNATDSAATVVVLDRICSGHHLEFYIFYWVQSLVVGVSDC